MSQMTSFDRMKTQSFRKTKDENKINLIVPVINTETLENTIKADDANKEITFRDRQLSTCEC